MYHVLMSTISLYDEDRHPLWFSYSDIYYIRNEPHSGQKFCDLQEAEIPIPIIIVNWNGLEDTVACIDSLRRSTYQNYRIYLVDNASSQREGTRLQAMYADHTEVEVWLAENNLGFAKANNWVIHSLLEIDAPYVVLLNNDTIVDPEWLGQLITTAQRTSAHIISSMLINYYDDNILDNAGHRMLNTGEIIPIGHGAPIDEYQTPFEHLGSCAAATLYDMGMIRHIGFFDDYFSTGYEDAEFGLRGYLAGYHCQYEPTAKVRHKLGSSIKKVFDTEYAKMIQRAIWYTYFKLVPWPAIMVSVPFIILKQLALLIVNLVFFRWRYIGVQCSSWTYTFKHWQEIMTARKVFAPKLKRSSKALLHRQTFFLRHDIKRFVDVYLKGKASALDQYGMQETKSS